jgi:hypothetical protein
MGDSGLKPVATLQNLHDSKLNCNWPPEDCLPGELQTEDYLLGAIGGPACGCGLGFG